MRADRGAIVKKLIKQDFSLEAWVLFPLGGLKGWGQGQNKTFSEYCLVAYQIKADDACSNMVANILSFFQVLNFKMLISGTNFMLVS